MVYLDDSFMERDSQQFNPRIDKQTCVKKKNNNNKTKTKQDRRKKQLSYRLQLRRKACFMFCVHGTVQVLCHFMVVLPPAEPRQTLPVCSLGFTQATTNR
jgi:hypothetical protein